MTTPLAFSGFEVFECEVRGKSMAIQCRVLLQPFVRNSNMGSYFGVANKVIEAARLVVLETFERGFFGDRAQGFEHGRNAFD